MTGPKLLKDNKEEVEGDAEMRYGVADGGVRDRVSRSRQSANVGRVTTCR